MRMDKLTTKFQMALAEAQSMAVGRDHQFIEPAHLLLALLNQEGGLQLEAPRDAEFAHTLTASLGGR